MSGDAAKPCCHIELLQYGSFCLLSNRLSPYAEAGTVKLQWLLTLLLARAEPIVFLKLT